MNINKFRMNVAKNRVRLRKRTLSYLHRIEASLMPASNDFDRSPLLLETLKARYSTQRETVARKENTAVYTTFCGPLSRFTFNRRRPKAGHPHFFYSNNEAILEIVKDYGWHPVMLDFKISENLIESAHQAKVAKALPHILPELSEFRYLAYTDDKQDIPYEKLSEFTHTLLEKRGALAARESPHISENVLFEFADTLNQSRYRPQAHQMAQYIKKQISQGCSLEMACLFMTGFVLRDMTHPDCDRINEAWYQDILECGIDCQMPFDFLAQKENAIVSLPKPPRKKYLGKPISDTSSSTI